jgi:NAD(P)H-dependent nitrite reductase large subunit
MLFITYGACFGVEIFIHNIAATFYVDRFGCRCRPPAWPPPASACWRCFARALGGYVSDKLAMRRGLDARSLLFVFILGEGLGLLVSPTPHGHHCGRAMLVFGLFTHMACGATYALVPFIDRKALGGVAGIIGAGGNVGAVAAGFLMKGLGDLQQTLTCSAWPPRWPPCAHCRALQCRAQGPEQALTTARWPTEFHKTFPDKESIMKIIVVGHGMVGHKFLECLADAGAQDLGHGAVRRARPAYDRVHLSEFFAGKSADDLSLVPGFFAQHNNMLLRSTRRPRPSTAAKTVTTSTGETLATTSWCWPPAPIRSCRRCPATSARTASSIAPSKTWKRCSNAASAKSGVVIGGGLLGLECAKALRDMGLETHVVEFAPRLMAVQVDDGGGRVLRQKIEELGVTAHTGKNTWRSSMAEGTHRMNFADGTHLDTDMIVFSAGIRPRDELARQRPDGRARRHRDRQQLPDLDPHVYAIGECALWDGKIFGLVAPGYDMARVAARHLRGEASEFAGADMSTKLKLMGVDVASIGDPHGNEPGSRSYQFTDERKQIYKKIVVSECGKFLLGGVLVGDAAEYGTLLQMMLNRIELPESPEFLILPPPTARPSPRWAPTRCRTARRSARATTSARARSARRGDGATTIGALKSCTKAGTACGGCVPLVTQVMKAEMKKQGMAVNNHVCEHFPYSRQELYHLVRVGQIKTFDDLLAAHGKGLGCDICKPTVGSILASCWNDFVLKEEHASLQDSTTTSWPTSRRTAPTRWCRACPAAKSRPTA